ncbi:hypothetical protein UFOVP252_42 [uncultured Caudovirales phage]|uniref:Uncharacterized protein n=1 Tax=uncultured Caudovirales phage TaxID=2100421 RepID=A0A6J5LMS1_9CAUD|nr:hypothetical protein UFOVP252_42 [uncultured Caudovirales phage]
MTWRKRTIMEMAVEAGLFTHKEVQPEIEAFAKLVREDEAERYKWDVHSCGPTCTKIGCVTVREAVKAEREQCAKVCDEQQELVGAEMCCVAMNCAAAIRARGQA